MLKFVHKAHYKKEHHHGQIVITYSVFEIIMGFLLVSMAAFYIYNYLTTNLGRSVAARVNYSPYLQEASKAPTLPKK